MSQPLPQNPTLKDLQTYANEKIRERGFEHESIPEVFMLFLEECGELAKAARQVNKNMLNSGHSDNFKVEEEVADVFNYLLALCFHLNIDIESAFRKKEDLNNQRVWKKK